MRDQLNIKYVQVVGVAQLGSIPALVFVDGTASGTFGVTLEPQGGKVAGYSGKAPDATLSQSGMHVSGDATESAAAGATAQTLTVSGDATPRRALPGPTKGPEVGPKTAPRARDRSRPRNPQLSWPRGPR